MAPIRHPLLLYLEHMAQGIVTGVAAEAVIDVFRFPLWWYSSGLVQAVRFARDFVVGYEHSLALRVWVKNIFVPMFGQYDWQSRIISVFMRLVNIVGRGLALMLLLVIVIVAFLVYLLLPMMAALFVIYHAVGAFVV